jgi:CheY-like chemotaxis protein
MSSQLHDQPTRPLSIFVVENHTDTLKYLQMYLEQLGHRVQSSRTVAGALAHLARNGCDVLISDISLPDGNGWDLLQALAEPRPIYAIAMSGFGLSSDRVRSKAAGYRHHVLKPFVPDDLDSMLEEAAREVNARPRH